MSNTAKHRLHTGSHGRWEGGRNVHYEEGDEILLTDAEVAEGASLYGRVEMIGEWEEVSAPPPDSVPDEPPAPADWSDAVATHWSAVAKTIRAQSDAESVRGIRAAEAAGQGRDGVLKACDDRLAELEGG
jgi:hypothetical protein